MTDYRIIPFHPSHVPLIKGYTREHAVVALSDAVAAGMDTATIYGRTLVYKQRILATGGIVAQWPTRGHVFLLCAQELPSSYPVAAAILRQWPIIRAEFLQAARQHSLASVTRLEASVFELLVEANQLVLRLGFTPEAERAYWGPHNERLCDYVQYFATTTGTPLCHSEPRSEAPALA